MAKSSLLSKISKRVKVTGISSDSRLVKKDDIFFAVTGYLIDGSKFIDDAIKRNASAIVTSNKKIKKKKVPVFYVNDVREALSYTAYDFYNSKINNLIAVTGTNGKTSVSYFIYHILRKLNKKVGIIGTIGNSIDVKEKSTLTTPDPISIAKILKKMKEKKVKYVVMEASSHGLEQKRLCGLNFDLGIMTNISHDHLDYHKNFQNYLNSKMQLFKRHLKTNGKAIINENTNEIRKIKKSLKNNNKVYEPIYSYKTHKRLKKSKVIFSKKIIIVEGLHILCDKRIINLIDYSIYLDVDEETRLQRRIRRDVEFRRRSINEVQQRYFYMCKPMHEKFINPSKKHADVILKSRSVSLKSILNLISKKIKC